MTSTSQQAQMEKVDVSYNTYKDVYPNFDQFTVFLNSFAVEAQDPVYGYNDVSTVIIVVSSNFPLPLFCTCVSYIIELKKGIQCAEMCQERM